MRKLRFIPVPIFKNNIQSSSEAPFLRKIGRLKIGLKLVEGPMEIMQIEAY